jgi:hypothetical protein
MVPFTHAGIGTVRMRWCFPTKSTMHQRLSCCWIMGYSQGAGLRSPNPTAEEQGRHRPVPFPSDRFGIGRIQHPLRFSLAEPVPRAHTAALSAERLASERTTASNKPLVIPADADLTITQNPARVPMVASMSTTIAAAVADQIARPTSTIRLAEKLWLNFDEAVAYIGFGKSRLQELVKAGQVRTERGPHRSISAQPS